MLKNSTFRAHLTRFALTSLSAFAQLACSETDSSGHVRALGQEYVTGTCESAPLSVASVTASSEQSEEFSIESAFDGDLTTRWSSDFTDQQEVLIDLGDERYITTVQLEFETATSAGYNVALSADGVVWGYSTGRYDSTIGPRTDELTFDRTARYLRFTSYSRSTEWGVSLYEMTVNGDPDAGCEHEIVDNQIYKIENSRNNRSIDVSEWGTENGANIHQWDFVGGENQKWQLSRQTDGSYEIRSVLSGKCLDIGGAFNGASAQLWECHGGDNQRFFLDETEDGVTIKAKHSGKCLDVEGYSWANGANIHTWDCSGNWNQAFAVEELTDAGAEAWSRSGKLVIDAAGHGYRQSYGPDSYEISRVDLDNGTSVWDSAEEDGFHIVEECGREDVLIGLVTAGDRRVLGLDPETGAELWSHDFEGQFETSYPGLRCDADVDYVLLTWNSGQNQAAIRLDGTVSWEAATGRSTYTFAMFPEAFVQRSYDYANQQNTIEGRNPLTHELLWTVTQATTVYYNTYEDELYRTDSTAKTVARVNPVSGNDVWNVGNFSGDYIYASLYRGLLYVSDGPEYAYLSRETGEELWRLHSDDGSPHVISEDYVATNAYDQDTQLYTHKVRDAATGEAFFEAPETSDYYSRYWVDEDHVYVGYSTSVDKYSRQTGEVVWSFSLENEPEQPQYISEIVEIVGDEVLITHYHPIYRYAHSGLISIDRESGARNWGFFRGTQLTYVAGTDSRVYVNLNYDDEMVAIAR